MTVPGTTTAVTAAPPQQSSEKEGEGAAPRRMLLVLVRVREGHTALPEDAHAPGLWAVGIEPNTPAVTEQWQCRAALDAFHRTSELVEPQGFELFVVDPQQNFAVLKPGTGQITQWGISYPSEVLGLVNAPAMDVQTFLVSTLDEKSKFARQLTVSVAGESQTVRRNRAISEWIAFVEEAAVENPAILLCDSRVDAVELDDRLVCAAAASVELAEEASPRGAPRMCQ